ncbi:MAG: outer membrane protein assembly factor BamA [Parvibaculales bacterium]
MRPDKYFFVFAFSLVLIFNPAAWSQDGSVETVDAIAFIRVEGSQRVEAETVMSYLSLEVGMRPAPELIDKSLKSLFKSGLFADVTITREDDGLLVSVVENPIVNRIIFEGNNKLEEDKLTEESTLRPRQVYTRSKVQDDVAHFVELYQRAGRFSARIEPKVIQLPQNRVDVVFEIDEGEVTKIRSINFLGNKAFDDDRLREEVSSKESRWYKFFASGDKYDPDRVNYDRELLRRFYLGRGFADFRVISSVAELTRDGKEFFITFNVEEGNIYSFGDGKINSNVAEIDVAEMEALIRHETGDKYNLKRIDDTVEDLTKILGAQGYAFADVRPRVRRDKEAKIVNVEYRIEEGPRVYVERININNNVRTQDRVIRREMRLDEGDAFNKVLLNRSERDIKALDYFAEVEITEQPGTEPDKTIIDIDVEEQSTGELSLGVGYSSTENFSSQFSIVERNLLGRGQVLQFATSVSSQVQTFNINFAEPYFLGRDLYGSVNLFRTTADYETEANLETAQTGIGGSVGFPVSEDGRVSLFARILEDELINDAYQSSFGEYLKPYSDFKVILGYSYGIDKRDDKIEPTEGWRFSLSQDIAGPLGDKSYLRSTAVYDYYRTFFDEWIFHARGSVGAIVDYNDDPISYNDHFFVGGSIIRGFKRSGVGPRDINSGYVLGAKQYVAGTLETQIPLGIPKELGIKGFVFTDFGMLGGTDVQAASVKDDFSLRATYGLSFSWKSPFGPVRFDLARPIVKEPYDSAQFFRFTAGTRF